MSAALLTGDPRPVSETAVWLSELIASRGVDWSPAIDDLTRVLTEALVDYPLSIDLVRSHFRSS